MSAATTSYENAYWIRGGSSSYYIKVKKSSDGKTLYWYGDESPHALGVVYVLIGIKLWTDASIPYNARILWPSRLTSLPSRWTKSISGGSTIEIERV